MLTGRPHLQTHFGAWLPKWISPNNEHNIDDMLELLKWRLTDKELVDAADLDSAAQLMCDKSKASLQQGFVLNCVSCI